MINLRKLLKERRMVEVDRSLAEHYWTFNNYPYQRALRPKHVANLASKMTGGAFRYGNIAFANANGGPQYLIDGQHVLAAVMESGESVPSILEKYEVANDIELAEAYMEFDILIRTQQDYTKNISGALKVPWPPWISHLTVAAIGIELSERASSSRLQTRYEAQSGDGSLRKSTRSFSRAEKALELQNYMKEGQFLYDALIPDRTKSGRSKSVAHLAIAPMAFFMFKIFRLNPNGARIFIERVRDGERLTREMPEMQLREFLKEEPRKRKVQNHEFIFRAVRAWNAYITDKPTRIAYKKDVAVPPLKGILLDSSVDNEEQ